MRIKKTSQVTPAPTEAQIVDGYSESSTDAYSCNYVNELHEYSTTEQRVGTWIDGKPIYRKVVDFGYLPNSTQKSIAHNISNLDKFVKVYGICTDGNTTFPLPMVALTGVPNSVQLNVTGDNIYLVTGINRTSQYAYVILEYTKTTD